jgi:TonB family protein
MCHRVAPLVFLVAAFAAGVRAQTDAWLEVRTPSFVVVSNAPEKDARRVARQFEQMRSVFHRVFPNTDLNTATPILVLAVQDKATLQALEPKVYLGKGQLNVAGLFLHAPERDYVLVGMNAAGQHPYAPIYHEYAHFVLHRTGQWMPLWLSEGWAEFYQNTEIEDGAVRLGKGDAYTLQVLAHNAPLPLPTLFAVDVHSPYYHEEDKGSIFYAESWALTHYLKMKDEHENAHHLDDYLDLLHRKADPVAAATKAFGDLTQLQSDLRKYIAGEEFGSSEMSGFAEVDDSSFAVRTLNQAQADVMRAEFLAHDGREDDARTLLEGALRNEPRNASALVTLGYMAFQQQHYDQARESCQEAVKIDPQNFFAQHCFAASLMQGGSPGLALHAQVENGLRAAIKINPSFAASYAGLGLLFSQRGRYEEALEWSQKAIQLEPGEVQFRLAEADTLVRLDKNKDAMEALDFALRIAHTPEETAAVENMQQALKRYAAERPKVKGRDGAIQLPGLPQGGSVVGPTGAGTIGPRAISTPQPEYTERARQARREGTCVVSMIVGIDGKTSNLVVTKKLGLGLDQKAVEAVKQWRFEPARRYGKPVITHLTVQLKFRLFGEGGKFLELSEKAKSGDAAAEFELANAFFAGKDIPKDESQGMALLERAAQDGLPQAQFQMGDRTYGDGTNSQNYVDAYVWYALAHRGGVEHSAEKITELEVRMTAAQLGEAKKRLQDSTPKAP